MRKKIIVGNWKMNMTKKETAEFLSFMKERINTQNATVGFAVPYTSLSTASEILGGSNIKLAAQNVHFAPRGAYTGEISIEMLKEQGVSYCIVGHSERRTYFNETDESVNKKVKALLEADIVPIVCVGETLEQREQNIHLDVIRTQIKKAIADVDTRFVSNIVIAYEPLWAIGTGKTATSEQAEEICSFIRYTIAECYGLTVANEVQIQYGGSVNETNASELLSMENIDGALVGGASLKPSFVEIIDAVK